MERRKKLNFWNEGSGFKFVSIKSETVNDQTNANYDGGNETISNTEVLKSIFFFGLQGCLHFSKTLYYYCRLIFYDRCSI